MDIGKTRVDLKEGNIGVLVRYAFFSSTLLVANKWALQGFPFPNLLLSLQFSFSALAAFIVTGRKFAPPTVATMMYLVPCVAMSFLAMISNFRSLQYLGVDTVVLLRVLSTIPVAVGDWAFNGRMIPSPGSSASLLSLVVASFFVFFDAPAFASAGIAWGFTYVLFIASDQVFLKYFVDNITMTTSERMLWVNALSVPVALGVALVGEELAFSVLRDSLSNATGFSALAVPLTCVLGVGISESSWEARKQFSALTFTLTGVLCKVGSIVINALFFAHLPGSSISLVVLGISTSVFYKQSEKRVASLGRIQIDANGLSRTKEAMLLAICVAIFVIGWYSALSVPGRSSSEVFLTNSTNEDPPPNGMISISETRRYSWHACVGNSKGEYAFKYRSCHFKGICYDGGEDGSLVYFASPTDNVRAESISTNLMLVSSDSEYVPINITIIRESLNDSARSRDAFWNGADRMTFFANLWRGGVWSHLVMDNFFAMFRIATIFGMNPDLYAMEPLAIHPLCDDPVGCPIQGNLFSDAWLSFLTRNESFWWRTGSSVGTLTMAEKYRRLALPEGSLLCFENLFAGLSVLSDHGIDVSSHGRNPNVEWPLWGAGASLWDFRRYVLRLAGMFSEDEIPTERDLLVLLKGDLKHASHGDNGSSAIQKVLERLSEIDPYATNDGVEIVTMEKMSVQDQIRYAATSKVVLSVTGSTSFPSLWLPRGGKAVLIMRIDDEMLDRDLYGNAGYLTVEYFNRNEVEDMAKSIISGIDAFSRRIN